MLANDRSNVTVGAIKTNGKSFLLAFSSAKKSTTWFILVDPFGTQHCLLIRPTGDIIRKAA
jgi:hypothetical protein